MPLELPDAPETFDVDDLMARIRAHVAHRRATAGAPSDPAMAAERQADPGVGLALAAQADFNRSLVDSLALMTRCLQDLDQRLEQAERNIAAQTAGQARLADLPARVDEVVRRLDAIANTANGHHVGYHGSRNGTSHASGYPLPRETASTLVADGLAAMPRTVELATPSAYRNGARAATSSADVEVTQELDKLLLSLKITLASVEALIAQRTGGRH